MNIEDLSVKIKIKKIRFWSCAYAYFTYCYVFGKKLDDGVIQKLINRYTVTEFVRCQS